jgi:uncharacterized protein YkwD
MSYAAVRSCLRKYLFVLQVSLLASFAAALPSLAIDTDRDSKQRDLLTAQEARIYMVELINRDRCSQGLGPVVLDGTANDVAQKHSDEMAQWSYVSHWDLKGRKPDERYSEAGGRGAVFENVYTNHKNPYMGYGSAVCASRLLPRREIEQAEEWFFNQQAPFDRHRRNILDPYHNQVGVGISMAFDRRWGMRITVAQEFVRTAAQVAQSPAQLSPGERKRISGRLKTGTSLAAIQICREGLPLPMTPNQLNSTGPYYLPPYTVASYLPSTPGYQTPLTVSKTRANEEFSMDLASERQWAEGLYYILVWVRDPSSQQPYIGSTQTVRVAADGNRSINVAQAPVARQPAALVLSRAPFSPSAQLD